MLLHAPQRFPSLLIVVCEPLSNPLHPRLNPPQGGNFLLNIGLDPSGQWAPSAVQTLLNMTAWFSYNAEAIHNTSAMFPYDYYHDQLPFAQYFTQSLVKNSTYVLLVRLLALQHGPFPKLQC